MQESSSGGEGLEDLLIELTAEALAGELVETDAVVLAHPQYEQELRRELPRILNLIRAFDSETPDGSAAHQLVPQGYQVVGTLKTGGQGQVLEVEDEATGNRAAFKVIADGEQAAFREAVAFARLRDENHPSIVKVLEFSPSGILMELLVGPDLDDLLDLEDRPGDSAALRLAGKLDGSRPHYRELAGAFANLARGIAALHDKGILHRDLKPQNVKVEPDRGLVLFDLGLARVENVATIVKSDTVLGTIPFLAPEAVPGAERRFDERTDVYGVGATLYSVLTNRLPHTGQDPIECLKSVSTKRPQPVLSFNPDVPMGLAQIAEMAMSRRPGDRYGSVLELAQDLELFAAGRKPLAEVGREARRRKRRLVKGIAAVGVLVLLLVGVLTWQLIQASRESGRERAEKDRAERVQQLVAEAGDLLDSLQSLRALKVLREALEAASGPEEELFCTRMLSEILLSLGRPEEAVECLSRLAGAGSTPELRQRATIARAEALGKTGDFEGAYAALLDPEEKLAQQGTDLLLESALRLGRVSHAWSLMEELGDDEGQRVLDQFALVDRLVLPDALGAVAIDDGTGQTALLIATRGGDLYRFHPDAEERLRLLTYPGDPIRNMALRATDRAGEVAMCGDDAESRGRVLILDIRTREAVHDWHPVRTHVQHLSADLDGDGRREHILCYQTLDRGVDVFDDNGSPLDLGELAELDNTKSDVRGILAVEDPDSEGKLLLFGTGPWDQTGFGFSLLKYRWRPETGFNLLANRRVGEVNHLSMADMDGDGVNEVYGVLSHTPTHTQGLIYSEFRRPGLYRINGQTLDLDPVHELSRISAYFDNAGAIRMVYPVWDVFHLFRMRLEDGAEAIVTRSSVRQESGDARIFLELHFLGADGPRRVILPTHRLLAANTASGDFFAEIPGDELVVAGSGEVLFYGRRTSGPSGGEVDRFRVSLSEDVTRGGFPPRGWHVLDRRNYAPGEEGSLKFVSNVGRGDRLVRPVDLQDTGVQLRFRAALTVEDVDYAGALHLGLFRPQDEEQTVHQFLCLCLARNAYNPRDLVLDYQASDGQRIRHRFEAPGSYRLKYGTPLELQVDYSDDPPKVFVSCRELESGKVLFAVNRQLLSPLSGGRYEFGIRSTLSACAIRSTTRGEIRDLELSLISGATRAPVESAGAGVPCLGEVQDAHYERLAGNETEARAILERVMNCGVEIAPLLVGPFAESSKPLARLALGMVTGESKARLQAGLLDIATEWKYAMRDPELAIAISEMSGGAAVEGNVLGQALMQLGRTQEACRVWPQSELMRLPEPEDPASRIACARAAIEARRPVNSLQPDYAERLLEAILADRPSPRAELDALLIGVRVALMRGDIELARLRLKQLTDKPRFEQEELKDYPEIHPLLK